jgi:hypothetical protein
MSNRRKLFTEFILIVAGVLVALMVDAWIEDREDAELRDEYLRRLADDVRTDIHNLDERVKFFLQVEAFGNQTLDWLASDEAPSAEILSAAFFASERWAFQPNVGTYLDLQNTGNIRLMDDIELRLLLAHYHSIAARRRGGWELPQDYREIVRGLIPPDVQRGFRENCPTIAFGTTERSTLRMCWPDGVNPSDFEDKMLALRADPNAQRALNFRISEVQTAILLYRDQKNHAVPLLEAINETMGK